MGELYKPGEDNKPKGTYKEVGPRGGNVQGGREVKIDPGDRLPPTSQKETNGLRNSFVQSRLKLVGFFLFLQKT
ncbi:YjzC family protein [Enterococcus hirae]|uniref:YjzC family protein n=1 Tax=Enterococcus TaxID=1350 RepID=UPI0019D32554|nr:YjzC family protein [Enterococcus hirae]EMF0125407.1 YjzC family protein [Enterococcus hirae]EMF0161722.1 YjzC family protein [Enterococcus hirae]